MRTLLPLYAMLFFVSAVLTGCQAGPTLWVECEDYSAMKANSIHETLFRPAASNAEQLDGSVLEWKDSTVSWRRHVPMNLPEAKIIFRYARLHWKGSMTPAPIELTVQPQGAPAIKKTLKFDNTGGWGTAPGQWKLLSVDLGPISSGTHIVTLKSLRDENSVCLDGFFIAPKDFEITAEELALSALKIDSQGYLGVASPLLSADYHVVGERVLSQNWETLFVSRGFAHAVKGFSVRMTVNGKTQDVRFNGKDDPEIRKQLALNAPVKLNNNVVGDWPDGMYKVVLRSDSPPMECIAWVTFAGRVAAEIPDAVKELKALDKDIKAGKYPKAKSAIPEIEYLISFFETTLKQLKSKDDPPTRRLVITPTKRSVFAWPAIADLNASSSQASQMMTNIKAGKDPYDGLTGLLRRSYISGKNKRRAVYRLFVPDSYGQKGKKTPMILFLHGAGGDENYWPDMNGGFILDEMNKRGYLAVMPAWHTRKFGKHWEADMLQLLEIIRKEYPDIDPNRIYVTGISMGGFGTYHFTTLLPDVFAAGVVVSGGGDVKKAGALKTTPLMFIHGGNDTVVTPDRSRAVYDEMTKLGYDAEYKLYPKNGHGYSDYYLPLTLEWFETYTKPAKTEKPKEK